jgi:uncharacterized protein
VQLKFILKDEPIMLLSQRLVYLANHKTLLIADVHFGKINHFRRAGIAVPTSANNRNSSGLIDAINETKAEQVIFLGDLFHSSYNEEWQTVGQLIKHFAQCSFQLVEGNHDVLGVNQYVQQGIQLVKQLTLGQWLLTHEPLPEVPNQLYNLCGHIHPGVSLRGGGRQSLLLPCFYFGKQQGILPAFGAFTGLAKINPKKGDQVFVIANGKIVAVK